MEDQLRGKPFWVPDATRVSAETILAGQKNGSFVIRRSSNPGCLALSHKLADNSFGHALIQWNGSGYALEQTTTSYPTIEALIKSLELRLDSKMKIRPTHVQGQPVIFQVEAITCYNAQAPDQLTFPKGEVMNVLTKEGNWYWGELDGNCGKFPCGLTKKVPGSDAPVGAAGFGGPGGMPGRGW